MRDFNKSFRPSNISRFNNCNLWRFLPAIEKTLEQQVYLAERSKDHERLEREEFLESEVECQNYFNYVRQRCGKNIYKENTLEMEILGETLVGTPDVFAYDESEGLLHILDYKTGVRFVHAAANKQLEAYAMLVKENFPEWRIDKVQLAILNTQADAVSKSRYEGTTFIENLKSTLTESLDKNQNGLLFGVSGDHCTFCESKRYCPLKRDYSALKDYADIDTDDLILTAKKRRNEMTSRENAIKSGDEISETLTPLVRERMKRSWRDVESLPQKFKTFRPMNISDAEKEFGYSEIESFTDTSSSRYLASG